MSKLPNSIDFLKIVNEKKEYLPLKELDGGCILVDDKPLFEAKFDLIPVRYGDYYIHKVAYTKTKKPYVKVFISEKDLKPYIDALKVFIPKDFKTIEENIRLEAEISFKSRVKADLDNRLKCLQDSLMKTNIIKDDSQIKELIIKDSFKIVKNTGATSIRIYKLK